MKNICVLSISFIIVIFFSNTSNANCKNFANDSPSIGILGDSFFTSGGNSCDNLKQQLKKKFETNKVFNSSVAGATVFGFKSSSIKNQKLKFKPDILIIGGGGNDFIKCGNNKDCLFGKINDFISPNLKTGMFIKLIKKHSHQNTLVFIVYTSILPEHAPSNLKLFEEIGLADAFNERVSKYASQNKNVYWVDVGKILSLDKSNDWKDDGFHPSVKGYKKIINNIYKFYRLEQLKS